MPKSLVLPLATALALLVGGSGVGADAPAAVAPEPSRGCSAPLPIAPGEQQVDTTSGGTPRWYLRHVPPAYDGKQPLPVVIDLHGYFEGAFLHGANSMLGAFGDAQGFVTITPQGTGDVAPHWDVEFDAPDVKYIGDLIDETSRTMCLDRRRIFVTGYSNGAFLSSTIACVFSDRVAAIAPVAGLVDPKGCKPTRPVPVITFHGTADDYVAFGGGLGKEGKAASASDGTDRTLAETSGGRAVARRPSTPKVVAAWAKRNGCGVQTSARQVTADVTRLRYRCPNHADVELYRIAGGGHTWPGSAFSKAIEAAIGPTTLSIDANAVMWEFFQAHPLTAK